MLMFHCFWLCFLGKLELVIITLGPCDVRTDYNLPSCEMLMHEGKNNRRDRE
jgi:hypothetical protein